MRAHLPKKRQVHGISAMSPWPKLHIQAFTQLHPGAIRLIVKEGSGINQL
jgi:hypothetical protein